MLKRRGSSKFLLVMMQGEQTTGEGACGTGNIRLTSLYIRLISIKCLAKLIFNTFYQYPGA